MQKYYWSMQYLNLRLIPFFMSFHSTKVLPADVAVDSPTTPLATTTTTTTTIIHKQMVYVCGPNTSAPALATRQWEVRVYSLIEKHWTNLPPPLQYFSSCALVNNHVTLIGGRDVSSDEVVNTLSTWYEDEGRWKQVLPPMPTGRVYPTIISRDNLLLVTGGVTEGDSTLLNTTDVLDLTTMKWTTPKGLDLPVPLRQHHLTLCGEYLYLVGRAITHTLTESFNTQETTEQKHNTKMRAWRTKWVNVKNIHRPQSTLSPRQEQESVWSEIPDPPVSHHRLSENPPAACSSATKQDTRPKDIFTYDENLNDWTHLGQLTGGRYSHCSVPPRNMVVLALADEGGIGSMADEFERRGDACSGVVDMYCSCDSI